MQSKEVALTEDERWEVGTRRWEGYEVQRVGGANEQAVQNSYIEDMGIQWKRFLNIPS